MTRHVTVRADLLVVTTRDQLGIQTGQCLACGASGPRNATDRGYSGRIGVPYGTNLSSFVHDKGCPVGRVLNADGSYKARPKPKRRPKEEEMPR
jgi:hypothetical protein